MRITRGLAAGAVAVMGLLAGASSALAQEPTYSAQGTQSANGRMLMQNAVGEQLGSDATTRTIAVTCAATAFPDAAATGIDACFLLDAAGRRFSATGGSAIPGPVNAATAVLTVPNRPYQLCMNSTGFFIQDGFVLAGTRICSSVA